MREATIPFYLSWLTAPGAARHDFPWIISYLSSHSENQRLLRHVRVRHSPPLSDQSEKKGVRAGGARSHTLFFGEKIEDGKQTCARFPSSIFCFQRPMNLNRSDHVLQIIGNDGNRTALFGSLAPARSASVGRISAALIRVSLSRPLSIHCG